MILLPNLVEFRVLFAFFPDNFIETPEQAVQLGQ